MDFAFSDRCLEYRELLLAFMDERIYPNESVYEEQLVEAGNPHHQPAIMEDLKADAKQRGLWNLFQPHARWGPGLSNLEYAPLAEILGRSPIASEACNCSAPDTGNMEVLTMFGTPEQHDVWLRPLLDGEIRSAFAMTEPDVASSDATNISLSIERDGDDYVLNGRKWWISGAMHPHCAIFIVMGKSDPSASPHRQQSQILVPMGTPGLTVVRPLPVFGYMDQEGHVELLFDNVRVPAGNMIANEGDGFAISQARLGPGRIHHCMRSIGAAERALELMCKRALNRTTFGKRVAERANIMDWIAEARIELEMVRLLTLKTAWLMDTSGNKAAAVEISAIKVAAPNMALKIIDRAIQVHGAGGVSDDFPLARMWSWQRALRFADGPDEVHKMTIARRELRRHDPEFRAVSLRVGVMYRRERPPEALAPFARFVEQAGLDELWIVEDCFWAAGPSAVAVALAATERLTVGLGIAPVVLRNPAVTAMEMGGIARMFPGRFVAGFGHGVTEWMRQVGALPAAQLAALAETIDAVRRLMDGDSVTVHGQHAHLDDVTLVFAPTPRPPIVVGVTGPKSIEVSARVADGLLLPEGSSAEFIAAANHRQGAGRVCVVYVLFAVDDDREAARAMVRASVDQFAPGDGDSRLALLGGEVGPIADRLSRFAVAGTPADCAAAIDALVAAGTTSVVIVPAAPDHEQQVRRLVDDVLPLTTT